MTSRITPRAALIAAVVLAAAYLMSILETRFIVPSATSLDVLGLATLAVAVLLILSGIAAGIRPPTLRR